MRTALPRDLPKRRLIFDALAVGAILALGFSAPAEPFRKKTEKPLGVIRTVLLTRIDRVFDPPVAPWVAGLLLGEDGAFSNRWKEVFRTTGTAHLTAVSGQNVGLVLSALARPLRWLPIGRRKRFVAEVAVIAGYVLLTGAPSSVVRASFMWACVAFAGTVLGRPVKRLRALLFAVLVLVAVDPGILLNDRGFELSVLATFGLASVAPIFTETWPSGREWKRGWRRELRDAVCQSAAASLMTAPLIAWMTGRYSIVSLAANVAVAAFIPILMAAGAILLAAGFVSAAFASTAASLVGWLFMTPLTILDLMSRVPFASAGGAPAWAAMTAASGLSVWALWRWKKRHHEPYEEI